MVKEDGVLLKVGIDIRILNQTGPRTGIPRYLHALVQGLIEQPDSDRWILFSDHPNSYPSLVLKKIPGIPWLQSRIPCAAAKVGLSIFHGPAYALPRFGNFRKVVTIHDLAFLINPRWADPNVVKYLSKMVPMSVKVADGIIVPSEQTGRDLREIFPFVSCPIRVIPLPHDQVLDLRPPVDGRRAIPYILHVGTVESRKNLSGLIQGFDLSVEKYGIPHHLLLAGMQRERSDDAVTDALHHAKSANRIKLLGYVSDDVLARLYRDADLYIQPSWHEGFGIGTLNAYVQGLPIISSKTGWISDVPQDQQIGVDFWRDMDPTSLAEGIFRRVSEGRQTYVRQLAEWGRRDMIDAHRRFYRELVA